MYAFTSRVLNMTVLAVLAGAPALAAAAIPAEMPAQPGSTPSPESQAGNIRALVDAGQHAEAAKQISSILNRTSTPEERAPFKTLLIRLADIYFASAEKASAELKFAQAVADFKQSLSLNSLLDDSSRNREILLCLMLIADSEEKLHDYPAALKSYTNLADLLEDPKNTSTPLALILFNRGKLLYEMSRSVEALKDVQRAISIYANQPDPGEDYEDGIKLSAMIQIDLYRYDDAEQGLRKLLAIQQKHTGAAAEKRVVNTMVYLAKLQQRQFKLKEAEALFKQAYALQQRLYPGIPESTGYITQALGYFYQFTGRISEADAEFRKNVALFSNKPKERVEYAKMLSNLADNYEYTRQYDEALKLYKNVLEIRESLFGPESMEALATRQNIANLHRQAGRYKEAETLFHQLLGDTAKLQGIQSSWYGDMLNDMAQLYNVWEKMAKAEIKARGALDNAVNLHGEASYKTVAYRETLVYVLVNTGRFQEAEETARTNLNITEKQFGRQNPKYAAQLRVLAMTQRNAARYGRALDSYRQALNISEQVYGAASPYTMTNRYWLGKVYGTLGEPAKAEEQYRQVIDSYEQAYGKSSDNLSSTLDNLAFLYMNDGRFSAAHATITRLQAIRTQTYGADNPENSQNTLAVFNRRIGNYALAEKIYQRDLEQDEKNFGASSKAAAHTRQNLAWLNYSRKDFARAEQDARTALAIYTSIYGKDNLSFSGVISALGMACLNTGKPDEAEQYFQRSAQLYSDAGLDDGVSQLGLGELHLKQKRYAEALPRLLEALRIAARENDLELRYMTLNDISVTFEQQGKADAALFFAKLAVRAVQKSLEDTALIGRNEWESYKQVVAPLYRRLATLLEQQGDSARSKLVTTLLNNTASAQPQGGSKNTLSLLTPREAEFEKTLEQKTNALTAIITERKQLADKADKIAEEKHRLDALSKGETDAQTAYHQSVAALSSSLHM